MRRFVIIGDGAAGTAAVELLRQEDPQANITLLSADPNPCYYRAALTNYLMGELRDGEIWAVPPDFYDRYQIDRQFCRAAQIDTTHRVIVGDDGRRFPYDALLIATGSRARYVEVPGSDKAGVGVFRTLQDVNLILHELPQLKQAVVSGGGILGLEWVHGLHERGVHPIFMMRQNRFWAQVLDLAASDIVLSRLERAGVELALSEEVAEVLSRDNLRISGVRTKSGREIECQLYGMAFGVEPNVEFLEGSGIAFDRRGVQVNDHMETTIPNVYAAGDVVNYQD
nr:NAD(P)/FAD-dependent oxidoreductase [Ardenticatenales bacterium]